MSLFCALALATCEFCASQLSAQDASPITVNGPVASDVDVKLRLQWSATQAGFWQFRVALASRSPNSRFGELTNRCEDLASTGAFHRSDESKTIIYVPSLQTQGGGCDLHVRCKSSDSLSVQLVKLAKFQGPLSPDDRAWKSQQVLVADLVQGKTVESESAANVQAKWSLRRTDEDQIRVTGLSKAIINDSSPVEIDVYANRWLDQKSSKVTLVYELRQASTGKRINERKLSLDIDELGNSLPQSITQNCPAESGVYEARFRFEKPDDRLVRFRRPEPLLLVTRPIAVIGQDLKPGKNKQVGWTTVGTIQPGKTSDWDLDQWLPNSSKKLLRRIDLMPDIEHKRSSHAGQPIAIVSPGQAFTSSIPSRSAHLPHLVTIRFAAKQHHHVTIEVCDRDDFRSAYRKHEVIGSKRAFTTDPWVSHTFVHYPRKGTEFLRITNQMDDDPFLLSSVTVDSGPESLSLGEAKSPEQRSVLYLSGHQWIDVLSADAEVHSLKTIAARAYRFHLASGRLMDYAKAMGYGAIMVAPDQAATAWYPSDSFYQYEEVDSFSRWYLPVLLSLADHKGVDILVGLDPTKRLIQLESARLSNTRNITRANHPTAFYNICNHDVQQGLRKYCLDLQNVAKSHSSFAGLVLLCENGHLAGLRPQDMNQSLLKEFAESVGKDLRDGMAFRGWLNREGQKPLQEWCQQRSLQSYKEITAGISDVAICYGDSTVPRSQANATIARASSNLPFVDDRRQSVQQAFFGVQDFPGVDSHEPNVMVGQHFRDSADRRPLSSSFQAEQLLHATAILRPRRLIVQEDSLAFSIDAKTKNSLRCFATSLQNRVDVPSVDPNEKSIRVFHSSGKDGKLILNVVNLAPWPVEVQVTCASELKWASLSSASADWQAANQSILVKLEGNSVLTLQADPSGVTDASPILNWVSRASGGEPALAEIKNNVTTIVKRMGVLSDPQPYQHLVNGSFEKPSKVGIPGWMRTQHPTTAVQVDAGEAFGGKQSVLLTNRDTQAGRAWLVSETIVPPATGRLAVSLACRAEQANDTAVHQLRVAIEGVRDGQSFRQSQVLQVPRNGQWKPREIVLEALELTPGHVDSLRLTVDSLTTGKIWVDEIQLHDHFPTAARRKALQGDAFLAVTGIQRGDLTAAARLLNKYWANNLLQQQAAPQTPIIQQATQADQEQPGVAQRIKSWLPRSLRF